MNGRLHTRRRWTGPIAVALLAAFATAQAFGETTSVRLRLYDPSGRTRAEVGIRDVERASARAVRLPDGTALSFRLTSTGAAKCHRLTLSLAKRGARLHHFQRFAFAINGRVYARPFVDYRLFPEGLDCTTGLEFHGLRVADARRLVVLIRRG